MLTHYQNLIFRYHTFNDCKAKISGDVEEMERDNPPTGGLAAWTLPRAFLCWEMQLHGEVSEGKEGSLTGCLCQPSTSKVILLPSSKKGVNFRRPIIRLWHSPFLLYQGVIYQHILAKQDGVKNAEVRKRGKCLGSEGLDWGAAEVFEVSSESMPCPFSGSKRKGCTAGSSVCPTT